jgi:hypothetical protein
LGAYAVLGPWAANIEEFSGATAVRPLIVTMVVSAIMFGLARVAFGGWAWAALPASAAIVLLTGYGHIYRVLEPAQLMGMQLGRHRHLIPAAVVLVVAFSMIGRRRPTWVLNLVPVANLMAVTGLVLPVVLIVAATLQMERNADNRENSALVIPIPKVQDSSQMPDVYYIVTDTYARGDVLLGTYQYDNGQFYRFLEEQGFYVADQSRANYLWTHLSLASALNMQYIQELLPDLDNNSGAQVVDALKHSRLRATLEAAGYSTVGFATGWDGSEFYDADILLYPDMPDFQRLQHAGTISDFEGILLQNSAAMVLIDLDSLRRTPVAEFVAARLEDRFTLQRSIALGQFENLANVPSIPGPKFVFAHILPPHGPHLFGRDGELVDYEPRAFTLTEGLVADSRGSSRYLDELIYITTRLEQIVQSILTNSTRPVVIVLQSDHGPAVGIDWDDDPDLQALANRAAILNAYYLPPDCQSSLYPTITPVNSFRVVLGCVFGAEIDIVPDRTYIGYNSFELLAFDSIDD